MNETLSNLALIQCGLGDSSMDFLAEVFGTNRTLKLVDLSRNVISDTGCIKVTLLLSSPSVLSISHNFMQLAKALVNNPVLGELTLSENHLTDLGYSTLQQRGRNLQKAQATGGIGGDRF